MTDVAHLRYDIDSSPAQEAANDLDRMAAASKKAEQAAAGMSGGAKRMSSAVTEMLSSIERSTRELVELTRQQRAVAQATDAVAVAETRAAASAQAATAPNIRFSHSFVQIVGDAGAAAAAIDKVAQESLELASAAKSTTAAMALQDTRIAKMAVANDNAAKSMKAASQAGLGLSRQFADIGVTAAMGMSPLMILIQQGPQIADQMSIMRQEGIGMGAAFKSIGADMLGLLRLAAPLGAVIGVAAAAFALFEREVDKNTKNATTFGDTWRATVTVVGDLLTDGPIGDGLKWLQAAFGQALDTIVDAVMWFADTTVGHFGAAYELVVKNWRRLPEVFGVIVQGAANIGIQAIEGFVNKAIDGLNVLLEKAGKSTIDHINLPAIRLANAKLTADYEASAKRISAAFRAGREGVFDRIVKEADKLAGARAKEEAATNSAADAARNHSKAANDNADAMARAADQALSYAQSLEQQVFAFGKSDIEMLRWESAMAAAAAPTKELADRIREAADQLIGLKQGVKAVEDLNKAAAEFVSMPTPDFTKKGGITEQLEEAVRQTDEIRYSVDDIYYSIRNHDWLGAFAGLFRVLEQLRTVLKSNADLATKIGAVGGAVSAVGGMIGGKAGSVISGAGSGAAAGAQLGGFFGPTGAAIGAVAGGLLGGLSSLFGSNKEKERRRNAEALARAEAELDRVREVAAQKRDLEIQLMEATGNAAGALAARRQDELRAMDASNRALQEAVWAAQDLAEARQKEVDAAQALVDDAHGRLSEAYDREAGALQDYIDRFQSWSDSLSKFLKGLYSGPAAMRSPEEQYRAARAEFDRVSAAAATGDESAIRDLESVSQAYLDASKDYYASSKEYFRDLERVRSAVSATQNYASTQVDIGQAQLSALNASVAGILNVNASVLSVRDALAAYQAAVQQLAAAQAAQQAANDNVAPGGASQAADWASYISKNTDVANEYLRNMGSAKGRDYLASLGISSVQDFGRWHWETYGKAEGRTPYAAGGIIHRPMTIGEAGIAGEAGPETIMPIANVNGKMGVHAVGGGDDEEKALLRTFIAKQDVIIAELQADKQQRAAMAEEQAKQNGRVEEALARISRTKAAA